MTNNFKFSQRTKLILKNFSRINPAMMFKPGKEIRTISPNKDLLGIAKIEEEIPQQFGIYDLDLFLKTEKKYQEGHITFHEEGLTFHQGNRSFYYRYTDANMILTAPTNEPNLASEIIIEFELLADDLENSISCFNPGKKDDLHIVFVGEDGDLKALTHYVEFEDSLVSIITLGKTDKTFRIAFNYWKLVALLPGDYKVTLSEAATLFETDNQLKYWIGPEINDDDEV